LLVNLAISITVRWASPLSSLACWLAPLNHDFDSSVVVPSI
jgi:hypothetical protein